MGAIPNSDAIYSRVGSIDWSGIITAAANDYTCLSALNQQVFSADPINGGFIQRLRFKAAGTNVASVARIFLNNGLSNQSLITAAGTPTGTAGSVGTCGSVTLYCKTLSMGQGGDVGTISAESTGVAVTGPNGSVTWVNNTPPTTFTHSGVRYYVGRATGAQAEYFWAPVTTATAAMSGTTTMTVSAILTAPNTKIGPALTVGTVFAAGGLTAGDYIVAQLTSSEADGSLGRTGTYQMSTARTFGATTVTTNKDSYVQLSPAHSMVASYDGQVTTYQSVMIGEISLPATTASATSATPDVEYPLNMAIPPGYNVFVGLGTAVAAGWSVTAFGGAY